MHNTSGLVLPESDQVAAALAHLDTCGQHEKISGRSAGASVSPLASARVSSSGSSNPSS